MFLPIFVVDTKITLRLYFQGSFNFNPQFEIVEFSSVNINAITFFNGLVGL